MTKLWRFDLVTRSSLSSLVVVVESVDDNSDLDSCHWKCLWCCMVMVSYFSVSRWTPPVTRNVPTDRRFQSLCSVREQSQIQTLDWKGNGAKLPSVGLWLNVSDYLQLDVNDDPALHFFPLCLRRDMFLLVDVHFSKNATIEGRVLRLEKEDWRSAE